jgi:2'-5' RNA ligase
MATKRLFIGTYADQKLFEIIYPEIKEDFEPAVRGKWVEPENLHFTLKFLGDVEESRVEELRESISDLTVRFDSPLFLKGMTAFPNLKRPRVLVVPVFNPDRELFRAHAELEKRLVEFGFPPEKRKFKPHMTLCRIKSIYGDMFPDIAYKYKDFEFGMMPEFSISLIESRLSRSGPTYTILQ